MNWTGRIVGALFGYFAADYWGALIGFIVGYGVDRARVAQHLGGGAPSTIQNIFFDATFSVMGHVCKVDGRVSPAEIGIAEALITRMSLSPQTRREAIDAFSRGKRADFDLDAILEELGRVSRWRPNLVRVFLEIQIQAAFADGAIDTAEHRVLLHIAERLGLTPQEFARLESLLRGWYTRGQATAGKRDTLADAYEVLGLSKDASDTEIKKAYRRLMNEHHPDKLMAKGLPKEMMKMAEEKTVRIRSAYDTIREARGH
jgi:DnaJ like chaperone protein